MATESRRPLIAVVEDDSSVAASLRFVLEAQGYDVCLFGDGSSAIASGEIIAADVLLIHYILPDMGGVTALEALRDRGLDCMAIIIASDVSDLCRTDAARAGAQALEKGVMAEVLNDLLRVRFSRR